jgi:hypothetical protein
MSEDLIARILRELDEEIVRVSSELSRLRVIRARVGEPLPHDIQAGVREAPRSPAEVAPLLPRKPQPGLGLTDKEWEEFSEATEIVADKHGVGLDATGAIVEAPEEPQEAPPTVAEVETPVEPEAPEKPSPEALKVEGISPELAEKLAKDAVKGPITVTHVEPAKVPKPTLKKDGTPRTKLFNYPATTRTAEEMLHDIRNWVVARGEQTFTSADLADGIGITSASYAMQRAQPLIDQGVIEQIGKSLPRVYKYAGKPKPEPMPKFPSNGEERAPGWKGEAVPGTGRSQINKTSDKDVQSLLLRVAAQIDTTTDGSGHIRVKSKRTGMATTVYSTPSSSGIDKVRAELRRIGVRF